MGEVAELLSGKFLQKKKSACGKVFAFSVSGSRCSHPSYMSSLTYLIDCVSKMLRMFIIIACMCTWLCHVLSNFDTSEFDTPPLMELKAAALRRS